MAPVLPPEVWISVFQHATHVPGTLVPDIYAQASHVGDLFHNRNCNIALRRTLITTRVLVRVCKQWWHLAIPYLYRSVYIGRARYLSSLVSTLLRSIDGKGTIGGSRPLGEYTERLDVAMRDHAENASAEFGFLATLITCMPRLAVISFTMTSSYDPGPVATSELPASILDALQCSAASLRVLDFSSIYHTPPIPSLMDLLAKCTQLRILHCSQLVWGRELEHGGLPSTLITLRVAHTISVQQAITDRLVNFDPHTARRPGPSALRELIVWVNPRDDLRWKGLFEVYNDQLVSVELCLPSFYRSFTIDAPVQLLTQICPRLRRLTVTFHHFSSVIRPNLLFPAIDYLGLRADQTQSPKRAFEALFTFLEELPSRVPSLRVVQLLNEHNVHCLLRTHVNSTVRAFESFMESSPIRLEDSEGVLLTDRLKTSRTSQYARPLRAHTPGPPAAEEPVGG